MQSRSPSGSLIFFVFCYWACGCLEEVYGLEEVHQVVHVGEAVLVDSGYLDHSLEDVSLVAVGLLAA